MFQFYVTDLFDGCIRGTNDAAKAADFAECEDYFVVDTKTGERLNPGNERQAVEEI